MDIMDLMQDVEQKFPAIITDLDKQRKMDSERDRILYTELYKLSSRDELIASLNEDSRINKRFVNCTKPLYPQELGDNLVRIKERGFFVYSYNEDGIVLVTDGFSEYVDRNVTLYLENAEIMYITPLNYELLLHGDDYVFDLYDPLTFYRRLVYEAMELKASDIHLENNLSRDLSVGSEFKIFYRLLNDYEEASAFKINKKFNDEVITEIVKGPSKGLQVELLSSRGVKTSWLNVLYDGTLDMRVTCSSTANGYTCVSRLQRMATIGKSIDQLGFDGRTTNAIKELKEFQSGLTLITGAVRTGKNTTAVAIENELIKLPIKIKEYSSPIETIMPFSQIDYGDKKDVLLNYINLVKKEDVDVVIINELPDKQIADAVVDLINSSMGVITTLHINRIWHLPYKLKDYFGEAYKDLITQINGVMTQKMFVKVCPHCARESGSRDFPDFVLNLMDEYGITTFKEGEGCAYCNFTGRANAVQPYAEYLIFDDQIKHDLLRCDKAYEMEDVIRKYVMDAHSNMEYSIRDAILAGVLTPNDFLKLR